MSTPDRFVPNTFPLQLKGSNFKGERDTKLDRTESDKVRERSDGQCEVWVGPVRCDRKAVHVHHMIGGRGKRGVGMSALARCKQHVCDACHRGITGDVGGKKLIRVGADVPFWRDRYRRVQ